VPPGSGLVEMLKMSSSLQSMIKQLPQFQSCNTVVL